MEEPREITKEELTQAVDKTPKKINVVMDSQILTALMTCGRMTDLRFNHRFQSLKGKSNSLECGSIVHTFLEVYYKCLIKGLDRDKAVGFAYAAAQLYIKGCPDCSEFTITHQGDEGHPDHSCVANSCIIKPPCGHPVDAFPGVQNTPAESEGYKIGWKFVLDTCERYAAHYRNEHWVPLEVETVKSKVLYEDDDIRILWKVKYDLISDTNQGIYPIDHKTMKQRRPTSNLNNQFTGQCLVQGTNMMFLNKIGFQKTLPDNERFERGVVSYSNDRLIEWQGTILPHYAYKLLEYVETGDWPPNFASCEGKYGPCPFHKVCESDPHMREEELRQGFKVGPEWNPTNEEDGD